MVYINSLSIKMLETMNICEECVAAKVNIHQFLIDTSIWRPRYLF
jgi:hypothetical protein